MSESAVEKPKVFTPELNAELFQRIMSGRSLRDVCRDEDMPEITRVFKEAMPDPDFAQQYARATAVRAEQLFDEIFEISDDASNDYMERTGKDGESLGWVENGEVINRSRLRIDTRKWALARMNPRKYGEKLALGGDEDAPPIKTTGQLNIAGLTVDQLLVLEQAIKQTPEG